jgi:hypothetical protein
MQYTRKNLREITGLPDKSLRWLLEKLNIQPSGFKVTLFGSKVFLYNDSALDQLHEYIFRRKKQRAEQADGKRCRGGCQGHFPPDLLDSQQICPHCRRRKWVLNEVTHRDPLHNKIDALVVDDLSSILKEFSLK